MGELFWEILQEHIQTHIFLPFSQNVEVLLLPG